MADTEHLLDLVKKIAEEQKFHNYDIKVTPISSGGANYTSTLNLIKVTEKDREDLNLFAKVAVSSETFRKQLTLDPFANEVLVYTKVMKAYRRLEDKHSISEDHRLKFPKFYGEDRTLLREILVLEDLTSRGFGPANRFKSVDWSYAAAALTELAKFHALSIAYQHEEPSEYQKSIESFPRAYFPENEETDMFINSSIKSALKEVREENKEKLKIFLKGKNVTSAMFDMFKPLSLEVLMHVDFRPNNMLHRKRNDGTTEVIPVDYQTIQGGCPIIDLLYFIFTATDGQFRAKYYQKLVDHYHSELGAALARFGLDVEDKYPRKTFEFELKEKLPYGLLVSIALLPTLTVEEHDAPKLDKELSIASFAIQTTGEMYSQRINDAVDDFIEYGVLK